MTTDAILALICGSIIGLSLGATGSGGSLLGIPLMVYVLGVTAQRAATLSLVLVGITSWFGVWAHAGNGSVRLKPALVFSGTGVLGAWGGAQGHRFMQGEIVLLLFGILMLAGAALMLWRIDKPRESAAGIPCAEFSWYEGMKLASLGFLVGLLIGFFGVGGGFIIVPALVLASRFPMDAAIGTGLLIVALTSLAGIVGHVQIGGLDLHLTTLLLLGSLPGMLLGTGIVQKVAPAVLAMVFSLLCLGIAGALILDNLAKLVSF